jgi:ribosomal-protein-alanine acetyltransferase
VANSADVAAMLKVELQSPGAAHWSQGQYELLFADTSDKSGSKHLAWMVENEFVGQSENARGEESELLGFLVAHRIGSEWELENMAVDPSVRRQGVGTLLLQKLIAQARAEDGRSIFLEVRESNLGARALYRRFDFERTGTRKSYYCDPPEDAFLYRLALN